MPHSRPLTRSEWALTIVNGVARKRRQGKGSDAQLKGAVEHALECGATIAEIRQAIDALIRLRF